MGSLSDYAEQSLLDHVFNVAYTPPATVYLGLSIGFSVRNATYRWTASGAGTSEYYLELAAGGDPGLPGDPGTVIENVTDMTPGALGSLAAGEWAYGDNDTLGFDTIYVRLSDSADPDSKAADYVYAGGDPLDDETGLTEPAGGSYARTAITLGAAATRRVTQSGAVNFAQATGTWGWCTHWFISDASGTGAGNLLASGKLSSSKHVISGNTPSVANAEAYVEILGEISTYLANNLLNLMFRNVAYSKPATYVALADAVIDESDDGSTISEPGGGAYAREIVNINGGASPTWDLAAAGVVDNTHDIDLGPASGASWGNIVAMAIVDDPDTAQGNVLFYDNGMTDQVVGDGDTARFSAGALDISMS